jgi:hypothetical protein
VRGSVHVMRDCAGLAHIRPARHFCVDSKKEVNETIFVDLVANSSNSLLVKKRGTGTIVNDD